MGRPSDTERTHLLLIKGSYGEIVLAKPGYKHEYAHSFYISRIDIEVALPAKILGLPSKIYEKLFSSV